MDGSGLIGNFEIRVTGVPNAATITEGSQRYILYNQNFIREISTVAESEWAATSILAHEVGHHLNGHTLDGRGSRPTIELEADYFSGYIFAETRCKHSRCSSGYEQGSATPTVPRRTLRDTTVLRRLPADGRKPVTKTRHARMPCFLLWLMSGHRTVEADPIVVCMLEMVGVMNRVYARRGQILPTAELHSDFPSMIRCCFHPCRLRPHILLLLSIV